MSRYVGRSLEAEFEAATVENRKALRLMLRERARLEKYSIEADIGAIEELDAVADLMTRAELLVAGFHRHHRGEWRRRRERPTRKG